MIWNIKLTGGTVAMRNLSSRGKCFKAFSARRVRKLSFDLYCATRQDSVNVGIDETLRAAIDPKLSLLEDSKRPRAAARDRRTSSAD
ncbi:hypothetical protein CXB37_02025 [Pseudomonas syringae pv. syringae]|nr:hypothetical protein CXB37_02025 [Pseudomonas syringae pv. syringae]